MSVADAGVASEVVSPAPFVPPAPDDDWTGMDTIESRCMVCGGTGVTRLMIHKVPNFRELIIASFRCNDCEEFNNEVTFGGEIQMQGCIIQLKCASPADLNRQLIKSDSAALRFPHLDFEIPPLTQKGQISTVEGFLTTAAKNLSLYQRERIAENPEAGARVSEIIMGLSRLVGGDESLFPFDIVLDDPAGNSYIENLSAPLRDPDMSFKYYYRSPEQDLALGLQPNKGTFRDEKGTNFASLMSGNFGDSEVLGRSEVISIPSNCPNCSALGNSLTAVTDIPHFKEVIIMAFTCEQCGFRNNEVKGGGAVPTFGTLVTLTVETAEDLKRDVLKSDSASTEIPELDLELGHGTLGGVYTTIEGLLNKILTSLRDNNPFAVGDASTLHHSSDPAVQTTNQKFAAFLDKLEVYASGQQLPFTLILRDPLGNSFVSARLGSFLPPEMDTNLVITDFERSFEENEDLGLNDINTKDFETGVEYAEHTQPDRLTHVSAAGADHPTFYAKGVDDSTSGGGVFVPSAAATKVPFAVDAPEAAHAKRRFADDTLLKFEPREEFGGRRSGFVFRMGSKGLGYYEDRMSVGNKKAARESS